MNDDENRNCMIDDDTPNCEYVVFNEFNKPRCGIDGVVSIRWFGCVPNEARIKLKERYPSI